MADISHNMAHAGFGHRVAGFIEELKARYARYAVYQTTLSELSALSARDLADLGITRSQIKSIAYEAAYKA